MKDFTGKYFHTFEDDGTVKRQGRVIGKSKELKGWYEVQYAEWMLGEWSTKDTVHKNEISKYTLYGCSADISSAFELMENK